MGGLAAFSAYFSMYAFRKPFLAAQFQAVDGWHIDFDFKSALIIAQVIGYTLSKFIGIKVVSEMPSEKRALSILLLVGLSWLALVGFAVLPAPYNLIMMLINGLPLGMIWGLVFAFLEGRKSTEVLTVILSASFIIASGIMKSVGTWLMLTWGITELWMPAISALIFFPLLALSLIGLSCLPPPSIEDELARTKRVPMDKCARKQFVKENFVCLMFLIAAYVFFTALRDIRDNFTTELWQELGYGGQALIFTLSELPITLIALVIIFAMKYVKDNYRAFFLTQTVIIFGALLIAISTFAFESNYIDAVSWMILSGMGLYIAYAPYGALLFDRLLAAKRFAGNAGFIIYLADSAGYAATLSILLAKYFVFDTQNWLSFYIQLSYLTAFMVCVFIVGSILLNTFSSNRFSAQQVTA